MRAPESRMPWSNFTLSLPRIIREQRYVYMKCLRAEQQLALFVGGDLPESETAELTAHLESCRACANELERLKRAQELLGKLARSDQPDPLPADFSGQVLAEIQKRRL